jgi:hypothetical protein
VTLPPWFDTKALLAAAVERLVAFVPGTAYSDGRGASQLRLAFSYPPEDRIREGIARLGALLEDEERLYQEISSGCLSEALHAAGALPLRDLTRVDMVVDQDGLPWVLEVNVSTRDDGDISPTHGCTRRWDVARRPLRPGAAIGIGRRNGHRRRSPTTYDAIKRHSIGGQPGATPDDLADDPLQVVGGGVLDDDPASLRPHLDRDAGGQLL